MPTARGVVNEAVILGEMGLVKNGIRIFTEEGGAVPDALTSGMLLEVKDRIAVSLTTQLRIMTDWARANGTTSVLVTGRYTTVTPQVRNAFDVIVRDARLGPPQ